MSPKNWRRVDNIFNEVLDKPPGERDEFLTAACSDFPSDVISKVEKLLRSRDEDEETLVNVLDEWMTTASRQHQNGVVPPPPPPIPHSLWELADRYGYEIREYLGAGGQGCVYLAYDRLHREVVALKTMRYIDAGCLTRFHREFDQAKDLRHSNLLRLYDLISDGHEWFFTMEFVRGRNFLDYVRPDEDLGATPTTGGEATGSGIASSREWPAEAQARLRLAFCQLVEGIYHLHQNDKIHCDIKHSNVLVTADGEVKILDYGLIRELNGEAITQHIQGTYDFMAPEQARGALSRASDWYSVGVMLYHALTGRMPFQGDAQRVVFEDKQNREPVPPRELVPTVPVDLDGLCVKLLRRQPQDRPSGEEVLHLLSTTVPPIPRPRLFIGRSAALKELREAYNAVRDGRTVQVLIHSDSGIGKSALLDDFLGDIRSTSEAVVLAGRCNERVVAPHEALRSIVDALTQYLKKPGIDPLAAGLLPRDLRSLLRLFPVLETVPAVASAPRGPELPTDQQELRLRGFAAFRELLQRLGDRRPLVLAFDDLQWADRDSALLLNTLLRPPDSPRLLLIGCYRTEDASRSPFLQEFLNPSDQRIVRLEALTELEARDMANQLLSQREVMDARWSEACAQASHGIPVFLEMLVQHAPPDGNMVSFDKVVLARVGRLPKAARVLLETVAVAARPLWLEEWFEAAGKGGAVGHAVTDLLREERLVRSSGSARASRIEMYHDRIREAILKGIASEALREHHRNLVLALRKANPDGADAEVLAFHLEGAGRYTEAGQYYGEAATSAARGLAFDRAADLYRRALDLSPTDVAEQHRLYEQLGAALANAGRGAEAAEAYLKAAEGAEVGKNRDLRRRAAEQFLRSGHVKEGLRVLDDVLREVGLRLPRTPRAAWESWLLKCGRLRRRGLRFRRREEREIPPDQLQLIDLCRSAAVGLCMVDPIRSLDFQARNALLALRSGEAGRIALALANQAVMCAFFGGAGRHRISKLLRAARALAHQAQNPLAWANLVLCRGGIALAEGRPLTAIRVCDRAEKLLRERCTGIAWELGTAQIFSLTTRLELGQHYEYGQRLPQLLGDAEARGDLFAATHVRVRSYAYLLSLDQPDRALQELHQAMEGWPPIEEWRRHGFHLQHYWFLVGQIEIALYRGDGPRAWKLVTQHESALRHSLLLQADVLQRDWLFTRAQSAIAAALAAGPGNPQHARALLREAEGDARRLERIKRPHYTGLGKLVRAGVAAAEGRTKRAFKLLTKAEQDFDAAGMRTLFAVARCRRAKLRGEETLYDETIASMIELKIQNPLAMLTMFAPGFESSPSVGGKSLTDSEKAR
jgi:serine/threonine protein kinase/tetratricopeptide (TPR) repeat protein